MELSLSLVHPGELSATARHCPLEAEGPGTYLQMDFRSPSMRAAASSCTLQCTGANRSVCSVSGRYLLFVHAQTLINRAKSSQLKKHLRMYMLNSFPVLRWQYIWAGGSRWELGRPWLVAILKSWEGAVWECEVPTLQLLTQFCFQ